MRAEFIFHISPSQDSTPHERFTLERDPRHHYCYQADFALSRLGEAMGECLVIGSPWFEVLALQRAGWRVTYLDVRAAPAGDDIGFIHDDACTAPLPADFYDAASTTCVLCHAGMGRYGDALHENGDELILMNLYRALKRGARAAVSFGPVAAMPHPARRDNCHRVYNLPTARRIAERAGFLIVEEAVLNTSDFTWSREPTAEWLDRDYLSMLLAKP